MASIQEQRPLALKTPLGEDKLLLAAMRGTEELGRLYTYELDLRSSDESIKLESVLGQRFTVRLNLHDGSTRFFDGFVSRFSHTGHKGGYATYRAILHPWLWFLTRHSDCRIFQEMTVPDIIKQVFKDIGFTDVDDKLLGSYRTRNYCVQYRETDFNFVSRLMEQEGIYYFFRQEDGKHTIVLADGPGSHEKIPGHDEIEYHPPTANIVRECDYIDGWELTQEVQPGTTALNEFDFENPSNDLVVDARIQRDHPHAGYEAYDYPGEYVERGDGTNYVKTRLEELHASYELAHADGNVRGVFAGGLFKLTGHPRNDQERDYLVVSSRFSVTNTEYESAGGGPSSFEGSFTALDGRTTFRPARVTPKPSIQGPQTAIVVGKSGEEIWTDKHGRVKVHFHWDRAGSRDENASCWVRVAQIWAGKNWGAIHIPRIGQEVIVEFLEGDPDRPIITGGVYNGEQTPPYALPANMTQSGIKSRSTKGGASGNFNEIRFEDKKGDEEIYIHAEKNHTNITENDRSEDVGHDRSLHVGNDKSESIDNNKTITVGVDHTESIGANKSLTVGANHDETIGASKTLSVGVDHTETIGSSMTISVGTMLTEIVGVNYAETVGAAMELTIGAVFTETVGGAKIQTIGAAQVVNVAGNRTDNVGGKVVQSVGKDLDVTVSGANKKGVAKEFELSAKKVKVMAQDEIVLVTGQSQITLKKDGSITIKGMKISVEGTQKIEQKAMEIKSEAQMKNEVKGTMVTVEASGINTIKGALVKIN